MSDKKTKWILPASLLGLYFLFGNKTSAQSSGPSPTPLTGWSLPIDSYITQNFVEGVHNGIDVHAPVGTPIYSPAPGLVEKVYNAGKGGNQLIIKHDNGYRTGYAHLDKTLIKENERVTQGQQIALSGNTGVTTGPHLHFVLQNPSGTAVNPVGIIYSVPA